MISKRWTWGRLRWRLTIARNWRNWALGGHIHCQTVTPVVPCLRVFLGPIDCSLAVAVRRGEGGR